ncbi:hypothetical protein AKJ16_DCAP09880 [Drosera capensis]
MSISSSPLCSSSFLLSSPRYQINHAFSSPSLLTLLPPFVRNTQTGFIAENSSLQVWGFGLWVDKIATGFMESGYVIGRRLEY